MQICVANVSKPENNALLRMHGSGAMNIAWLINDLVVELNSVAVNLCGNAGQLTSLSEPTCVG